MAALTAATAALHSHRTTRRLAGRTPRAASAAANAARSAPASADLHAAQHEALLAAHTELFSPALLPELRLHRSRCILSLWLASEAGGGPALDAPYWAVAWPGGQGAARYVLDHPSVVRGKRVLDVGAGGGVAALAALLSGAAHVTANDTSPLALAACTANARANALGDALRDGRMQLDATNHLAGPLADDAGAHVAALLERYDVIMAGDMTYLAPLAAAMRALLADSARVSGVTLLLGDAGRQRAFADVAGWGLAQVGAYVVTDADADPLVEGRTRREVAVWSTQHGGPATS